MTSLSKPDLFQAFIEIFFNVVNLMHGILTFVISTKAPVSILLNNVEIRLNNIS